MHGPMHFTAGDQKTFFFTHTESPQCKWHKLNKKEAQPAPLPILGMVLMPVKEICLIAIV